MPGWLKVTMSLLCHHGDQEPGFMREILFGIVLYNIYDDLPLKSVDEAVSNPISQDCRRQCYNSTFL